MKPLLTLLLTSLIALVVLHYGTQQLNLALAGRIGMACMLALTAYGHFAFSKGMTMMVPDVVPYKQLIVYATGILEVVAENLRFVLDLMRKILITVQYNQSHTPSK